MKRETYLHRIEFQLAGFMSMVRLRTSSGRFDLNIIAEDFFRDLLNIVYGYNLKNLNRDNKNNPSVDLADTANKLAIS
jgi:hypothetical protein